MKITFGEETQWDLLTVGFHEHESGKGCMILELGDDLVHLRCTRDAYSRASYHITDFISRKGTRRLTVEGANGGIIIRSRTVVNSMVYVCAFRE